MSSRAQGIVLVVNRGTVALDGMSDGRPIPLPAGYKLVPETDADGNPIVDPKTKEPTMKVVGAAPDGRVLCTPLSIGDAVRVRRQHPLMGSEDPSDLGSVEYLIAIPALGQDYSYLEQSDSPEVLDRSMLLGPNQRAVVLTRRKKVPKRGQSGLTRAGVYSPELFNPNGIQLR